ncbi:MAG: hypothetical protein HYV97_19225 [Bdellovibrio sp.]|nr:hypothetical protein [Bdellovibrio sp.]
MKTLLFLISSVLLCLPPVLDCQEREPDSTPSSLANIKLKEKLRQQVTSNFKTYFFGEKSHIFAVDNRKNILITRRCNTKLETSKCLAALNLKQVNMNDINDEDLAGGKNPGSVLCQKSLKADIIIGKDQDGNITTFCSFKDGTMVSADTLAAWGNKNAQRNKQ